MKTPRTDAEERWTCGCDDAFKCVDSSFARQLEREVQLLRELVPEYLHAEIEQQAKEEK